jgi:hypothetical protein
MTTIAAASTPAKRPRAKPVAHASVIQSHGGRIVRLSDPEMRPAVDALVTEVTSSPAKARKWLQELGYLTPKGNVTRRYSSR